MNRTTSRPLFVIALLLYLTAGCSQVIAGTQPEQRSATPAAAAATSTITVRATPTPTQRVETAASAAPAAAVQPGVWLSGGLPPALIDSLRLPASLPRVDDPDQAALRLAAGAHPTAGSETVLAETAWVYALAAPFPTLTDSVTLAEVQAFWRGEPAGSLDGSLLVAPQTLGVFEAWWGPSAAEDLRIAGEEELLDAAWEIGAGRAWAILPFEAIQPRWKVIRVDGLSPLDRVFDETAYGLALPIQLAGNQADYDAALRAGFPRTLPANRQPGQLTVLALTGVTALSRQTAETMQREGATYPGRDIADWLRSADLAHISNEVSFTPDCPAPGPARRDMRFCSAPENIALLEFLGTDIVELTGNHILDWGRQPFLDTLEMYRQRGWHVYGGGENLGLAQRSLLVENNGNRLAFIGCSPSGPPGVWATASTPGSAPCDFAELEERIARLRKEGWLPVVTLQAVETDWHLPAVAQAMPDFRRLARAGAVIVSGSQSHYPQTMTFVNDSFVHYGLGNLFFDQMDLLATRQGFIDRHVFYQGRYLGVELLTTLIEDYARPRPMTPEERSDLLTTIFSLSQWRGE